MDEQILEAVSQNDEAYEGEMLDEDEPFDVERPTTADDGESGVGGFFEYLNPSEAEIVWLY